MAANPTLPKTERREASPDFANKLDKRAMV
jgi:hypothetical protein